MDGRWNLSIVSFPVVIFLVQDSIKAFNNLSLVGRCVCWGEGGG